MACLWQCGVEHVAVSFHVKTNATLPKSKEKKIQEEEEGEETRRKGEEKKDKSREVRGAKKRVVSNVRWRLRALSWDAT